MLVLSKQAEIKNAARVSQNESVEYCLDIIDAINQNCITVCGDVFL